MDERRREGGSHSPAPTFSGGSSINFSESPATEPPPPRRRGQKRKSTSFVASGSSSAPPKRHAREKAAAAAAAGFSSFFQPSHNGPLTRARQMSDNNAAMYSAFNAVKNEQSMVAPDSVGVDGREEVKVVKEDFEALEAAIEAEIEAIRSRDANAHVVPVAAGWFSWADIHPLEKQALRSFFNGKSESRTPEIYLEIRNWIMKRFHANPNVNIELKDLSALSIGDLDARQEVMEFLDHWGLINYHPFPPSDPANIDDGPNTDVGKAEETDSLIDKLYQFENEQSYSQIAPRANASTLAMAAGLFPESAIAEELVKQEGPSVEYHCNSCSADCSRKRYHCQKEADFDLCRECYNNGKFGSGMCPSDFILMEPGEASGASGGKWTDQETLLLLEALELYKENWNEIAEHVATKTKAQCILHFLQMPIEDGFLDYDNTKDAIKEIPEPTLISNDSSVPNENSEASEVKTVRDESEPAETASAKLSSELPESKSSKDDPGPPESRTDADTAQPVSITESVEDAQEGKVSQDKNDNVVLMALMNAFDAVGSPLTPDDKLSFAEAGNPVMALAAFLSQLVEPGVAIASARSSLKSMSKSPSGLQLAARHCFLLEDPPDDKKDQTGSESATCGNTCQNPLELVNLESKDKKEINHNEMDSTNQCEKKSAPLLGGTSPKDDAIQKKGSTTVDDPELPSEKQDVCAEKLQVAEKSDEEKSVAEKSGEEKPLVVENSDKESSQVVEKLDNEKSPLAEKPGETSVEQTGQKALSESENPLLQSDQLPINPKEQHDSTSKGPPSSANDSGNLNAAGESVQCTGAPKHVDEESSSVLSDKREQQEEVLPNTVVGVGSETGEDRMEIDKPGSTKSRVLTGAKDDPKVAKLKRAALATLSAASVKAKLLANQEEDEIRQLAALLIEKQLRKVEIKLSFFNEMDNAIMRVREQLERSRQKLFNERAQIIASRLGLSASSSRVLPTSFPINRMPPGLLNSMLRPPMSIAAQRPPMLRPVVTSAAPPTTNAPVPPGMAGGGPTQPTASEKPSSAWTN